MGREVKRVDLNFDWYEKTKEMDHRQKIWPGYTLDLKLLCLLCEGAEPTEEKRCRLCYGGKYVVPSIDPPSGEGWQMWETVSEGSPISPVFKTPEELASWLTKTKASAGGSRTATYAQWLRMIKMGFAPSGAIIDGEFMSGVEAVGRKEILSDKDPTPEQEE